MRHDHETCKKYSQKPKIIISAFFRVYEFIWHIFDPKFARRLIVVILLSAEAKCQTLPLVIQRKNPRYMQHGWGPQIIDLFFCVYLLQNSTHENQQNSPAHGRRAGKATLRAASEAELARNVGILRARQRTEVDRLRQSLAVWIEENTQAANDVAVSIAMLETAFDRYIDLHGAAEAFDLIESAFRRRAEIFRRSSLQSSK